MLITARASKRAPASSPRRNLFLGEGKSNTLLCLISLGSTITVRLRAVGDVGVLTVDDQGPGIAAADRESVFDRFWRAEESRTMPGSGLGLSIVRQVADRHSGWVRAEEAPGGGARLVLELPGRTSVPVA